MKIIVDNSNIINISYCSNVSMQKKDKGNEYTLKKEDMGMYFHLYLRKIMPFLTTYKDVIFCGEGMSSIKWRHEQIPQYKENRKDRKDNPDFAYIGDAYRDTDELLKHLHCKTLRVDYCEGDDAIYQCCKYYAEQGEECKIISTDKDLTQIINFYPNLVTQYNPIKQCNMEANPNILLEKAICGDPSDNIKVFRGIGPKTFEKMMNDKAVWNKKMPPENMEMLEKVLSIVDLRKYPQQYQDAIVEEIKKPWNELDVGAVDAFLSERGLIKCFNDWHDKWLPSINALDFEQPDAMEEIMDILNGK